VRLWWNRFGPLFAADIQRQRVSRMRAFGIGAGTLMRCSSRSMASGITCGVRWTMRWRSWNLTSPKTLQICDFAVSEESVEVARSCRDYRHGWAAILPRCDAHAGQSGPP
jgi:hypothetical protein